MTGKAEREAFERQLRDEAASAADRLHGALALPPGMSIEFSTLPVVTPSPHELWVEAGGDPERYAELLREHRHVAPIEPCATCGVATNHRHDAAGATIPTDIFGHDKR